MDMKKILQAIDSVSTTPVEGSNDMKKFLSVITEGTNPHKVTLPVQMAMQHYSNPTEKKSPKTSLLKSYFETIDSAIKEEQAAEQAVKEQHLRQYSQRIAERVLMKESWSGYHAAGTKKSATTGKQVRNCVKNEEQQTTEATALEKFRKAADEREKKHDKVEKEMKARHARGEEDMKGSIDRLEKQLKEIGLAEGWSDAIVSRRTGTPRTPYSVYIKGKKWKDFENDDHARAVMDKLKDKFKADGRDPSVITIAPTDYDKI
jgi:bacterioferritin (cytochrome b1)